MTRHTRNRQLVKLGEEDSMWRSNVPIDTVRKEKHVWGLDPTFKWERTAQIVVFKRGVRRGYNRKVNTNSFVKNRFSLFSWGKFRKLHNAVSFDVQEVEEGGTLITQKRIVTKTKKVEIRKKKVHTQTKGWRVVQ